MTDKRDGDKLRYDLIPHEALEELAKVLTFGAAKYDDNNWQTVTPFERRYRAALMRHFEADRRDELWDAESGELHLSHALCCLVFLVWRRRTQFKAERGSTSREGLAIEADDELSEYTAKHRSMLRSRRGLREDPPSSKRRWRQWLERMDNFFFGGNWR